MVLHEGHPALLEVGGDPGEDVGAADLPGPGGQIGTLVFRNQVAKRAADSRWRISVIRIPGELCDRPLDLVVPEAHDRPQFPGSRNDLVGRQDRKSTRLNSSHVRISYAVFCLKKKKNT